MHAVALQLDFPPLHAQQLPPAKALAQHQTLLLALILHDGPNDRAIKDPGYLGHRPMIRLWRRLILLGWWRRWWWRWRPATEGE
ncbi:MAG: hypothetical protein BGO79_08520 [Delftia sp. 67-8]|nr:MAG: hypothetical protein BGO79_08520 [Delftia sp. 67-8]